MGEWITNLGVIGANVLIVLLFLSATAKMAKMHEEETRVALEKNASITGECIEVLERLDRNVKRCDKCP